MFAAGVYLVCCRLPKRRYFPLRVIISAVLLLAVYMLTYEIEQVLDGKLFILIGGGKFVLQ